MIWCIKTYIIAYVKTHKKKDLLSIMSNLQPNCCLKFDFQKADQHAGGKWLIHDTKRHKDIDELQSNCDHTNDQPRGTKPNIYHITGTLT